jgi:hypothetical protein
LFYINNPFFLNEKTKGAAGKIVAPFLLKKVCAAKIYMSYYTIWAFNSYHSKPGDPISGVLGF